MSARVIFSYDNVAVTESELATGDIQRALHFGPSYAFSQGGMILSKPSWLLNEFTRNLFWGITRVETPQRALVLGVGPGSVPKALRAMYGDSLAIDVVDISATVLAVARDYFLCDWSGINIYNVDAGIFVEKIDRLYDYICVDIWDGEGVPDLILDEKFWHQLMRICDHAGGISINAPERSFKVLCDTILRVRPAALSLRGVNTSFYVPEARSIREILEMKSSKTDAFLTDCGVDVDEISTHSVSIRREYR